MSMNIYCVIAYCLSFGLTTACPASCHCFTDDKDYLTVDCSNRSLTRVPAKIPTDCNFLYLGENSLTIIPAFSFRNLTQLLILDLSENAITCLHVNVFNGLLKLETLRLNKNTIAYNNSCIPPGVFRPLVKATSLYIGQNANISDSHLEYPDDAIGDMRSLQHLGIDGLTNKAFGPGFKRLRSLLVLDMNGLSQRCFIETLYNATLQNFRTTPLKEIILNNCVIYRIYPEAFAGLQYLELLDLSNSRPQLRFDQFEPLSFGLQTTNISCLYLNKLSTFDTHNVLEKEHLRYLRNTQLKELELDNNDITWIEKEWISETLPRSLEKLSINYNFILGDAVGLVYVAIYHAKNLKEFKLSPVHTINQGKLAWILPLNLLVFVLTAVNSFGIAFPTVQFSTNSLKTLIIKDGSITAFIGPAKGLTVIETLEFSNLNCFNISYDYFKLMPTLTSINLSINFLGQCLAQDDNGQLFEKQSNLLELNLSRNSITRLSSRFFQGLRHIRNIDLSHNAIRDLNVHIDKMPFLNALNLFSNQLLYLPPHITYSLDIIARKANISVDIGDNLLTCDCSSYPFLTWMTTTRVHFFNQDRYNCILDGRVAYFDDLETILISLDQLCASHDVILALCSCCIAIILTTCVGGIIFRYRLHITYLYYAARRQCNAQNNNANEEYAFTAFLSFAESEWDVVKARFMFNLENIKGYRLCIHHRDFIPGTPIASNISNAIHFSKKTIVLLTRAFLESNWCKFELYMALMEHIYSGRQTLIIIKFPDIPAELMDLEILSIMRYETVLDYFPAPEREAVFWNLLERAMCDLPL